MEVSVRIRDNKVLSGDFLIIQPDTSEEEFYAIADEDLKCELLNGVLVIHSPANVEHEDIFSQLHTLLRLYLDETHEGKVYGSRLVMRLSPAWNPEPDLLVITPEQYPNLAEGRLEGPAAIVFEILSKSTRDWDLKTKVPEFLRAGVKELWVIDPELRTIALHTPHGHEVWASAIPTQVIASHVLTRFFLKVEWIWNREVHSPAQIIREMLAPSG